MSERIKISHEGGVIERDLGEHDRYCAFRSWRSLIPVMAVTFGA